MKRIIIIGAGGVGKTTLVEALAPLLSLPQIPELGRELCLEMGYEQIGEIPDQLGFKKAVLERQVNEEERLGQFVSDRSTIDCWVLWQRWNICTAMTYDTEAYYEKAKSQARKYTHIIYVRPMFPPVDDGFRWTEPDYQKQIDRLHRMTLYDFELWDKTLTIEQLKVEDRVEAAAKWIETVGIMDRQDR
ncbi:MAG: ATP-binding protein [Candidatus Obscuribacterales bacterium]|nr:ATP-binding protein [Candidatus Obscuribacterales bacterium]